MRLRKKDIINLQKIASDPKKVFVLLILGTLIFFLNPFIASQDYLQGKVVKVIDGDTITLLDEAKKTHRIRLFAIDAPESNQAFGKKSRDFLASMIASKHIKAIKKDKDKYGRIIAKIELNNEDINKKMVENGYAWAYTYYSDIYKKYEEQARSQKLGLWVDKNPIEPYKWRKMNDKND